MHYINILLQRRLLLAATITLVIGCILVAWTLATVLSVVEAPPLAAPITEAAMDSVVEAELEVDVSVEEATAAPAPLIVYITGAIVAPDVYQLADGARLKDLVLAAGGFLPEADAQAINLAAPLSDAEHIHIPRQNEMRTVPETNTDPATSGTAINQSAPLDLNSASVDQLDALPGIGPAIAERIVVYREENGPFATIADLANVKGIGTALIEKIAPFITIGS